MSVENANGNAFTNNKICIKNLLTWTTTKNKELKNMFGYFNVERQTSWGSLYLFYKIVYLFTWILFLNHKSHECYHTFQYGLTIKLWLLLIEFV